MKNLCYCRHGRCSESSETQDIREADGGYGGGDGGRDWQRADRSDSVS